MYAKDCGVGDVPHTRDDGRQESQEYGSRAIALQNRTNGHATVFPYDEPGS